MWGSVKATLQENQTIEKSAYGVQSKMLGDRGLTGMVMCIEFCR